MAELVRAFVAVELSGRVREALARAQQELRRVPARVRWTAAGNLHLTLVFLGDVTGAQAGEVGVILDEVCGGIAPFVFTVAGLGTFGSPRQPRVIWAGVPEPPAGLVALARGLREWLVAGGFALEDRSFHPHLTLGRVRGPQGVAQLTSAIASANNTGFGEVPVRRVVLMQSRLEPDGPHYTVIRESALKGP